MIARARFNSARAIQAKGPNFDARVVKHNLDPELASYTNLAHPSW